MIRIASCSVHPHLTDTWIGPRLPVLFACTSFPGWIYCKSISDRATSAGSVVVRWATCSSHLPTPACLATNYDLLAKSYGMHSAGNMEGSMFRQNIGVVRIYRIHAVQQWNGWHCVFGCVAAKKKGVIGTSLVEVFEEGKKNICVYCSCCFHTSLEPSGDRENHIFFSCMI